MANAHSVVTGYAGRQTILSRTAYLEAGTGQRGRTGAASLGSADAVVAPVRRAAGAPRQRVLAVVGCPATVCTAAGKLQVRSTAALLGGHVIPVSPSGLSVLRLLVEARGDVVSRSQVLWVLPGDSRDPHAA